MEIRTCIKCREDKDISYFKNKVHRHINKKCDNCLSILREDSQTLTVEERQKKRRIERSKTDTYKFQQKEYYKKYILKNRNQKSENLKKWKKANPKRNQDNLQGWHLKKRYGLTVDEYNKKLHFQKYKCAVCEGVNKNNRNLAVDHNHETGKIRDLLCQHCNLSLGLIENHYDLINKLLIYKLKHKEEIKIKIPELENC